MKGRDVALIQTLGLTNWVFDFREQEILRCVLGERKLREKKKQRLFRWRGPPPLEGERRG